MHTVPGCIRDYSIVHRRGLEVIIILFSYSEGREFEPSRGTLLKGCPHKYCSKIVFMYRPKKLSRHSTG